MQESLKFYYRTELKNAEAAFIAKEYIQSWRYLERAHILAQPYAFEHTAVHWKMLVFGMKIKNLKEVFGQIPRLIFGGVKSFVGTIPVGNTGGSNVPPLRSMPIPDDLQEIIRKGVNEKATGE